MQHTSATPNVASGPTQPVGRAAVEAAVLDRLGRALAELACRVDRQSLDAAVGAQTDLEALLDMLLAPSAVDIAAHDDPLARARLRWVRDRERLLHAEGRPLATREVVELLGISRQAVAKAREEGRLIGLPLGPGRYVYPSWQFGPSGPLRGLRDLHRALDGGEAGPWTLSAYILAPNCRLDGRSPLELLRSGEIEPVLEAARAYGEQGAA